MQSLLQPENRDQLTNILTYHVVPGKVTAADLSDGQKLETVAGETLTVKIDGDKVKVGTPPWSSPTSRPPTASYMSSTAS